MRTILNPVIWMEKRRELIHARARAIKHHRSHTEIDAELREVTTSLIAWANRRDDETEIAA